MSRSARVVVLPKLAAARLCTSTLTGIGRLINVLRMMPERLKKLSGKLTCPVLSC